MRINKSKKNINHNPYNTHKKIKLHGICVCENFGDYLDYTMSYNRSIFDTITIVTTTEDYETRRVCHKYNLNIVITDRLHKDGAPFNKAAGLNDGYSQMNKDGWVVIFDSDMVFPSFNNILKRLDKRCLYGIPRKNIGHRTNKIKLQSVPSNFKINAQPGRVVIGYCQIFYAPHLGHKKLYNERYKSANRSDTRFALQWERDKNIHIDNLYCYHISREKVNWRGRKSPKLKVSDASKK